jgi:hypothetical protein
VPVFVYRELPPLEATYQFQVPFTVEDAPIVTIPVPHRLALMAVIDPVTTNAVTATLALVHVALEYAT